MEVGKIIGLDEDAIMSFEKERRKSITAAKELRYGVEVVERLRAAKSYVEITNIMAQARKTLL